MAVKIAVKLNIIPTQHEKTLIKKEPMKLELKNIKKVFGRKTALNNISFTAKSGHAFGLLGRNGAGKTTTIRILMNVFKASSGEILLDGKPLDHRSVSFGYLPEERGLYPKEKVFNQLVYLANLKGMNKKDAAKSVNYWLDFLDMSEYKNKQLDTLSKGNQQKIQLISSIAHDPDIIVFDEPFSGLDPVNAKLLENVVKEQIKQNKIIIFSSHQMNYIEEFCDDILIMKNGEIMISGNIKQIKQSYERNKLKIESKDVQKIKSEYENECKVIDDTNLIYKMTSADQKQKIMQKLIKEYDIDSIGILEPTLNDIFVEYAGDEKEINEITNIKEKR